MQAYNGSFPAGGASLTVGGVPFTLAHYSGGGTGIILTNSASQASPDVYDIPVNVADPTAVYTLINSSYGVSGFLDGTVEFIGAGGADAVFNLTQGTNIRDYNNDGFNNTVAPGTPSVSFQNGQVRLDMQSFQLPASFATDTLTDIRFSGFGNYPNGLPFLAAVTVTDPQTTTVGGLLTLDATTGPLHVNGGTVQGGTITDNSGNGADGVIVAETSTLDGVTLHGNLDVTSSGAVLNVLDGLTLGGSIVSIGNASGAATLSFAGTELLGGTGTLVFSNAANSLNDSTSGSVLTIGPNITLHGSSATIGGAAIVNHGAIEADTPGGAITNNPTTFTNQGTIEASGGGSLSVTGLTGHLGTAILSDTAGTASSLSVSGAGYTVDHDFNVSSGETLSLLGSFSSSANITATGATLNLGTPNSTTAWSMGTLNATNCTINLGGQPSALNVGNHHRLQDQRARHVHDRATARLVRGQHGRHRLGGHP